MPTSEPDKLWHDDIRRPPDETWFWARTNREAMHYLLWSVENGKPFVEVSLDHDMGLEHEDPDEFDAPLRIGNSDAGDGYDLVVAMIALRVVPPRIVIHSLDSLGARQMFDRLMGTDGLRAGTNEVIIRPYEYPRV